MEKDVETVGLLVYREEDIRRNERFISLLKESAKGQGHSLLLFTLEQLIWKIEEGKVPFSVEGEKGPSYMINRSVSPWLNEMAAFAGIPAFNSPFVARIANDKRLAHAYFQQKNIPMLQTVSTTKERLQSIGDMPLPFPFVMKDPLGRGGTGVQLISSAEELASGLQKIQKDVIIQPVCGQPGKDLRVYIVGNKVVGAVLRQSVNRNEIRANISTGGTSRLYELNNLERAFLETMCKDITLDFVGIDFLFDEGGNLLFNEMEDAVGCRSLYMNSSINIADVFLEYVNRRLNL
ncbi:RimK family alpha-L-glutamate ligase [Evansella vedderi]|uniref:RimK family alpha-L-glutamate ligase n=1 Tax=Evansella vedderi TaxID=38282 RepID=A0ABT9ZZW8_9BACI|nr:hypothetical protein [Evansella vedderi]MDQ0256505.1 RimK family alpha-L-glutamate ligase [Evansella vedderi]